VHGWLSSVLVNTGTGSLLFVPLFLVQRALETKVRETQQYVDDLSKNVQSSQADLQQSIDELRRAYTDREAELLKGRQQDVSEIAEKAVPGGS
jgi:xanthine/CO dehydrogenase XdhC/CoxF family maturation factor